MSLIKGNKIHSYLSSITDQKSMNVRKVLEIINYTKPTLSNLSSIACEDLITQRGILDSEIQMLKKNLKTIKRIRKLKLGSFSRISDFPIEREMFEIKKWPWSSKPIENLSEIVEFKPTLRYYVPSPSLILKWPDKPPLSGLIKRLLKKMKKDFKALALNNKFIPQRFLP